MFCRYITRTVLGVRPLARYTSTKTRNKFAFDKLSTVNLTDPKLIEEAMNDDSIHSRLKPITPSDLYVSCTTVDRRGNITSVSKRYPKMQFLKDNNLYPRDLRKIDTSSIDVSPSIMIRPSNAILINLLHIKAIIKKDSVKVFDTSTPDIATKLGLFMSDLGTKLKLDSGNVPYEFRALESILVSITSYLETELKTHTSSCGIILRELEDSVDRQKLQDLLIRSKKLSSFHQKALLIRNVLEEVLENDEDLAGMYLSNPKDLNHPEQGDYEDLEMILESYYNHCDEFVQQAGALVNDIKATEEIANIILDTNRNSLMLFELKITVYTLGFTVATLLPAYYGMNLKNYIEDSNWGFMAVLAFSIAQGIAITLFNFRKLRHVQKLTMMGTNATSNAISWRSPRRAFQKDSWIYKLFWGTQRNTIRTPPTKREKDAIWRMIYEDKHRPH